MPPPSVSPPTPVVEMIPQGTASPCGWVAASTSAHVQPPPTRTVLRVRIDRDVGEQREIGQDAVVDAAEATSVVAASACGQRQVVRSREGDRGCDVLRARAARDHGGSFVDHRVEKDPGFVVARVVGPDQLALERRSELTPCRNRSRFIPAHHVPPLGTTPVLTFGPTGESRTGRDGVPMRIGGERSGSFAGDRGYARPVGSLPVPAGGSRRHHRRPALATRVVAYLPRAASKRSRLAAGQSDGTS